MKIRLLIIIGIALIPLVTLNVSAMCVAEELEWWESCDDTRSVSDSCPVIHFLGYAWEDCGSIFTWNVLGIPLLMILVAPIGIVLAVVIWRKRK